MFKKLFFKFDDYKLERFQVENLSTSIVPFTFYSLDPLPELDKLLIKTVKYNEDPISELEKNVFNKESPVVFVCKNSKKSKKILMLAVERGYQNAYFVDGGFKSIEK